MQRGKFARLAVTVDLTKSLVSKFTIDGEEFEVEYENLQELCFHCGIYGHLREVCPHRPKGAEVEEAGESSGWRVAFPEASVTHPARYQSDHHPLLLKLL